MPPGRDLEQLTSSDGVEVVDRWMEPWLHIPYLRASTAPGASPLKVKLSAHLIPLAEALREQTSLRLEHLFLRVEALDYVTLAGALTHEDGGAAPFAAELKLTITDEGFLRIEGVSCALMDDYPVDTAIPSVWPVDFLLRAIPQGLIERESLMVAEIDIMGLIQEFFAWLDLPAPSAPDAWGATLTFHRTRLDLTLDSVQLDDSAHELDESSVAGGEAARAGDENRAELADEVVAYTQLDRALLKGKWSAAAGAWERLRRASPEALDLEAPSAPQRRWIWLAEVTGLVGEALHHLRRFSQSPELALEALTTLARHYRRSGADIRALLYLRQCWDAVSEQQPTGLQRWAVGCGVLTCLDGIGSPEAARVRGVVAQLEAMLGAETSEVLVPETAHPPAEHAYEAADGETLDDAELGSPELSEEAVEREGRVALPGLAEVALAIEEARREGGETDAASAQADISLWAPPQKPKAEEDTETLADLWSSVNESKGDEAAPWSSAEPAPDLMETPTEDPEHGARVLSADEAPSVADVEPPVVAKPPTPEVEAVSTENGAEPFAASTPPLAGGDGFDTPTDSDGFDTPTDESGATEAHGPDTQAMETPADADAPHVDPGDDEPLGPDPAHDDEAAWARLRAAAEKDGRWRRHLSRARRALAEAPDGEHAVLLREVSATFIGMGVPSRAVSHLKTLIDEHPDDAKAESMLRAIYAQAGNHAARIRLEARLAQARLPPDEAHAALMSLAAEAQTLSLEAVQQDCLLEACRLLPRVVEPFEALDALLRAAQSFVQIAELWGLRAGLGGDIGAHGALRQAQAYLDAGDLVTARIGLERLEALGHHNEEILASLMKVLALQGDREALAAIEARLSSGDPHEAALARGEALLTDAGSNVFVRREAEDVFESILEERPAEPRAIRGLAQCRIAASDVMGAIRILKGALESCLPEHREGWLRELGDIYLVHGEDPEAARACYEEADGLSPSPSPPPETDQASQE